jgi:hypothetical protein
MRRTMACAMSVIIMTAAVGCSSSSTTPAAHAAPATKPGAPSTHAAPVATTAKPTPARTTAKAAAKPSSTCNPADEPNIILWMRTPGTQDVAQLLGGWNPDTCDSSIPDLLKNAPTGPGFCTAAAYESTNAGYDVDATPAPRLKHVVAEVGGSC